MLFCSLQVNTDQWHCIVIYSSNNDDSCVVDIPCDAVGGGNNQFSAIPLNFADKNDLAEYVITGAWSKSKTDTSDGVHCCMQARLDKVLICAHCATCVFLLAAYAEAHKFTNVHTAYHRPPYTALPTKEQLNLAKGAKYLHYCANETVHGVEFPEDYPWPAADDPLHANLIVDMSSNFMSRPIDVTYVQNRDEYHSGVWTHCTVLTFCALCMQSLCRDLCRRSKECRSSWCHHRYRSAPAALE